MQISTKVRSHPLAKEWFLAHTTSLRIGELYWTKYGTEKLVKSGSLQFKRPQLRLAIKVNRKR